MIRTGTYEPHRRLFVSSCVDPREGLKGFSAFSELRCPAEAAGLVACRAQDADAFEGGEAAFLVADHEFAAKRHLAAGAACVASVLESVGADLAPGFRLAPSRLAAEIRQSGSGMSSGSSVITCSTGRRRQDFERWTVRGSSTPQTARSTKNETSCSM